MLINFLQFLANFLIAATLLKVLSAVLISKDENSQIGKALGFIA